MGNLVGDDDHIGGAEAICHIVRNIHTLLHRENGLGAFPLGGFDLANHIGHILIDRFQQIVRVVIRDGAFGTLLEVLFDEMLCQGMTRSTLCGIAGLFLRKLLTQHHGRCAMQNAVQS